MTEDNHRTRTRLGGAVKVVAMVALMAGAQFAAPGAVWAQAESAAVPTGWQGFSRYGLAFALPPDFQMSGDYGDEIEGTRLDNQAFRGIAFVLDDAAVSDRDRLIKEPADEGLAVAPVEPPLAVGDAVFSRYRVTGRMAVPGGEERQVEAVLLISDTPGASGSLVVVRIMAIGLEEAAAQAEIAAILATLTLSGTVADLGVPPPRLALGGLAEIMVGAEMNFTGMGDDEAWLTLGGPRQQPFGLRADLARLKVQSGVSAGNMVYGLLQYEFESMPSVRRAEALGHPAYIVEGVPVYGLDDANNAKVATTERVIALDLCLADKEPVVVTLMAADAWLAQGNALDSILGQLALNVPESAGPCTPETFAHLAAVAN